MIDFKVSCYLIVRSEKRYGAGKIMGVKVVGLRQTRPALAADEATIKVTLDVPDSLFDAEAVGLVVEPRDAVLALVQDDAAAVLRETPAREENE